MNDTLRAVTVRHVACNTGNPMFLRSSCAITMVHCNKKSSGYHMLRLGCKMAISVRFADLILVFAVFLAAFVQPVAAFDGGDVVALIIGLVIGIMCICACVGAYARKQGGWPKTDRKYSVLKLCKLYKLLLYTWNSSLWSHAMLFMW